jgi:hypothetical protein
MGFIMPAVMEKFGNTLRSFMTVRHGKWPIEIDGLPNLKMVDLSMANC